MAWHMGHPLSQSLFTSLYIDRLLWPEPKLLEHACFERNTTPEGNAMLHIVLRAFCLGLIKTCDYVYRKITTEHFYEVGSLLSIAIDPLLGKGADHLQEEDFVTNLYHRKLLTNMELSDIDQKLLDAVDYLKDESLNLERALRDAIINRLELRRYILSAARIDDIVDPQRATYWGRCLQLAPALETTAQLGTPVNQSFSAKMQRSLASTVPPRPIVIISFDDAHAYLVRLCQYGRDAYRVLDFHGGPNLLVGNSH